MRVISVFAITIAITCAIKVYQNNVGWNGVPGRAIDGRTDNSYGRGSCTHSSTNRDNWWLADLEGSFRVTNVRIYNRGDCCQNRINFAKVYVGEMFCGEVIYNSLKSIYDISCMGGAGIIGTTVKIVNDYNYLTLCEVQITKRPESGDMFHNVAPGHSAVQNNEGWGGNPYRAIDKRTNGIYGRATCTHSSSSRNNWWKLQLELPFFISYVVIHNRIDCCQNRINLAEIYAGAKRCAVVSYANNKNVYVVACNALASEIVVKQPHNYLTLCEVEVMVKTSNREKAIKVQGNLLSQGKATGQNSVGYGGVSSRAVDGKTSGIWGHGSCTHSAGTRNNWWYVNLGKVARVTVVKVHNRQDCCQNRINLAKVYVDKQYCGELVYQAGKNEYMVDCQNKVGSTVTIYNDYNYLTLCEVQVYGFCDLLASSVEFVNIAPGHDTSQNSVGWGGVSYRGVDGGRSGWYGSGQCTHSARNTGNWWSVDLKLVYPIHSVVIHNRVDCCQDRINGASVKVGGVVCGQVKYEAGKSVYVINCGNRRGSVIRIEQPSNYLTLCEVEVMVAKTAVVQTVKSRGELISKGKTATQNSVGWNGHPGLAVDGKKSQIYNEKSCTHSLKNNNNWWKLNLGKQHKVNFVKIYNRMDCCQERIKDAKVLVDDTYCGSVHYEVGKPFYWVECEGGVFGTNVIIVQNNNYLTLCEVEVYGTVETGDPLVNIAPGFEATHSSECCGGEPNRAIDGRLNGMWGHASCQHSGKTTNNWWMVNLQNNYVVDSVVIHNREDCCQDRINGAKVFVGDKLCGVVNYIAGKNVYRIGCRITGASVSVFVANNYLTLCEVQVLVTASSRQRVLASIGNLLSQGKPTSQNNVGWGGSPALAVDGKTSGIYNHKTCSHSLSNSRNWWYVDLGAKSRVTKVEIYNRADCCQDRIKNVKVYVGDEFCSTVSYRLSQAIYTLDCNGAVGNKVWIYGDYSYLTLCEVKVYGKQAPEGKRLINIAPGHPTSQDSTAHGGSSARAIDRSRSGYWGHGSCTHSSGIGAHWWKVNLQDEYDISRVVIHNRIDCCQDRIDKVEVWAGSQLCGKIVYSADSIVYPVNCPAGTKASEVTVKLASGVLTLCEVEVLSNEDSVFAVKNKMGTLLSHKKRASQNNIGWGGIPSRGVDGNVDSKYNANSCTHTSSPRDNWWSVDLDTTAKIEKVVIYNRMDCCSNRINLAKVYVNDEFCGEISYHDTQTKYIIDCHGFIGSKVTVVQNDNYLTLCEVLVYGNPVEDEYPLVNIAPGHIATQSSIAHGGLPVRAIDGRTNGQWNHGACTHTATRTGNWWKVDLVDDFQVKKVVIHNRIDCCQDRINGAKVLVGGKLCGIVKYEAGKHVYPIECDILIDASAVSIYQDSNILTLCEVEILATAETVIKHQGDLISRGKHASQNSVGWGGVPTRAVDGRTTGIYNSGSCTHSRYTKNNWWKVELGGKYAVKRVKIYNRQDCCQNRISFAKVYVGDVFCGEIIYVHFIDTYTVHCEGAIGKDVRVIQNDNYLTLCEVEVYGESTDGSILRNVAVGMPATSSSTGWGGLASRAVDGKVNGFWAHASCQHSQFNKNNNWQVNLGTEYEIKGVVVHNRRDCCQNRINGAKVYVGDQLCGTIKYVFNTYVYPLKCDLKGSFVRVTLDNDYLTLCEVEVLANEDKLKAELGDLISRNKATSQSSEGWRGASGRAVDGKVSGIYNDGTCTHSAQASHNWWKVSLGRRHAVSRVEIYNRLDCCQNRIHLAKVYVGDIFCGEVMFDNAQTEIYTIQCGGAIGDNVRIIQNDNYLTLCEVNVYGKVPQSGDDGGLRNVALGHPTSAVNVGWGGIPSRAVDGHVNSLWNHRSCYHSQSNKDNWWKVDLASNYDIEKVVIHNRRDCCQNRINGAQVYVGDKLCGKVEYVSGKNVYVIECPPDTTGSTVAVKLAANYLTLCEVEVLGTPSNIKTRFENVAVGGKAIQSTTAEGAVADRAIDGNTDGDYFMKSCTHTSEFKDQYWSLELADEVLVDHVVVYNRGDCCSERINGVVIYVGDKVCGKIVYNPVQRVYKIDCDATDSIPKISNKIKIVGVDDQPLTLCEVKVMTDPTVSKDEVLFNLAYKKPTTQSSTGWGGLSLRAVDGKLSSIYNQNTCTHTHRGGWWKVNLMDRYLVDHVKIFNREDCCSSRLKVNVYVGGVKCGYVGYQAGRQVYTLKCNLVGSSVMIVNPSDYLTLCEVQVMGKPTPIRGGSKEVIGPESERRDDAKSIAKCPDGYVVSSCFVGTADFRTTSDGATLENSGSWCVAHSSWKKGAVKARAFCSAMKNNDNPCGGAQQLPLYKYVAQRAASAKAECPKGYKMVECIAHSYWAPGSEFTDLKKFDDLAKLIDTEQPCAVTCTAKNPCTVTAICKLEQNSDAYKAAVCPNCEGFDCGEGNVCSMDGSKHVCKPKHTGCINNVKCGDYGVCVPVGSEGYKCDCKEGYIYYSKIGTCVVKNTKWDIVEGDEAEGVDAESSAECRGNLKVKRCHTFGLTKSANGVTIREDGGLCVAKAGDAGDHPIQAIAYCGDTISMPDPCTGKNIDSTEYRYAVGTSPKVECPDGYIMSNCIVLSSDAHKMPDAAKNLIDSIGSVKTSNGICSIPNCATGTEWCRLTAVCSKLSGLEYKKNACPTCDKVSCPDNHECSISSETKLPVCNEIIPGGCDVDKCGDNGKCIEKGADYTCDCKSGYKFDMTTCVDVDECEEDPCGNGKCKNNNGSYSCDCNKGFKAEQGTCKDIDECKQNPCKNTMRCSNTDGSYTCDCPETYFLKRGKCKCAKGYEEVNSKCVDIDECKDAKSCDSQTQVCKNNDGSYSCECKQGYEKKGKKCKEIIKEIECGVKPKKSVYQCFQNKKCSVKLKGELKKTLKKYADITWTKDDKPYNPKSDGKSKFNGFVIAKYKPENVGTYKAEIRIEQPGKVPERCTVEFRMELKEAGKAEITIDSRRNLSKDQKRGSRFSLNCKVKLVNVKLDDPKDPNNVNWYKKVADGDDILIKESASYKIEKNNGSYKLTFLDAQPEQSGTYICEFDKQGAEASSEIAVNIKS